MSLPDNKNELHPGRYTLYLKGHGFRYEMENVARAFLQDVRVAEGQPRAGDEQYIFLRRTAEKGQTRLLCVVRTFYFKAYKDSWLAPGAPDSACEMELARILYDVLCLTVKQPPVWGVVTGIRPAKYAANRLAAGQTPDEVAWHFSAHRRVAARKAALAIETARYGMAVARRNMPRSYSLYVSIPFCPTRCSYCSFVSKTVDRDHRLIGDYLDALCDELAATAQLARQQELKLESVYIGGGTPTVLTEDQLRQLCAVIGERFDVVGAGEYSVEAGRPDTITPQKLRVLKEAGVTRLSINPQTANDAVLAAIGRNHTTADVERAFGQAGDAGFDCINADLIAGLPRDDLDSFKRTMDWLLAFVPQNITLHALTRKRASRLNEFGGQPAHDATAMIDYATPLLRQNGYAPYYMYKQKGTVDGLENTGWAKPETACVYNVYMMDELHTILSCGAGAVTKLVDQQSGRIERVFNYKYPAEYLSGFDRLLARKEKITAFYEGI